MLKLLKKNRKQITPRNMHANPSVYAIGSKVLVMDFTHKKRKEGKLDFRWIGPYYIMKNLGKGSYLLQEESIP